MMRMTQTIFLSFAGRGRRFFTLLLPAVILLLLPVEARAAQEALASETPAAVSADSSMLTPNLSRLAEITVSSETVVWTLEEERTIAYKVGAFVETHFGLYPDPAVQEYVAGVGARLAQNAERRDITYEFKVLDVTFENAFAFPGGKIYITAGLLERLENEAQLAHVLGHEMGHLEARHQEHSLEKLRKAQGISRWLGGRIALTIAVLPYSREAESEADRLGLKYAALAGYDPGVSVTVMELLKTITDEEKAEQRAKRAEYGEDEDERERQRRWRPKTHPDLSTRIEDLEAALAKYIPDYQSEQFVLGYGNLEGVTDSLKVERSAGSIFDPEGTAVLAALTGGERPDVPIAWLHWEGGADLELQVWDERFSRCYLKSSESSQSPTYQTLMSEENTREEVVEFRALGDQIDLSRGHYVLSAAVLGTGEEDVDVQLTIVFPDGAVVERRGRLSNLPGGSNQWDAMVIDSYRGRVLKDLDAYENLDENR